MPKSANLLHKTAKSLSIKSARLAAWETGDVKEVAGDRRL